MSFTSISEERRHSYAANAIRNDIAFSSSAALNQLKLAEHLRRRYDYIVCGSGSSGSVVARRLAEDRNVTVLLLEAGGSDDVPAVRQASEWFSNLASERDWGFIAEPNSNVNGRAMPLSMAKVLGGGSSINAMIWSRGHRNDWNFFSAEADDPSWSYESVLKIYRKIEDWKGQPDPVRRGKGGLLYVAPSNNPNPLVPAMIESASELGITHFDDQNGVMMEGAGGVAMTNLRIRDGKRQSIFRSYVYPLLGQQNLTVLTHATVSRILIEGTRALGVEAVIDGQTRRFEADIETVISLGAINTPKLLMQSGIGDSEHLRKNGIGCIQHLPGVGQNFQDHFLVAGCVWEYEHPDPEEIEDLFKGYGWSPYVVEGSDPDTMHQKMAATVETCILKIQSIQEEARCTKVPVRPRWPMIILRSPKGWTGPQEVDGHRVENFWRAHQIPVLDVKANPNHLKIVEQWMRSYKPQELFDNRGTLIPELRRLQPAGNRRMSANPHANGGRLRKPLDLPDFRDYCVAIDHPGTKFASPTETLGKFLRDVMRRNMNNFRVFSPDENASNRLQDIYQASLKTWLAACKPEDADGTNIAPDGRVMEMLSEHTLEGWLEGYLLTGRHGLFNTYESFAHIIDSMYNQFSKWLEKAKLEIDWRSPVSSLNLLITSLVWRQDHNGFTHEDPGFLDVVSNKSAGVTRIYLPPDANCLLSVADHCLRSVDYVNVIVSDKQQHLVYLDTEEAVVHCTKGIGIWNWASNDAGCDPDVVVACAGDVPTQEALAAVALLREGIPDLKIRFVNVVDLYRLQPDTEHPHGLSDRDFDSLFTVNKPVIFNFHGYPWLIHKFTYRRTNHSNMHVRGYKEKGNINTPLELAIRNQIDRFDIAIDVIDRVPRLRGHGVHLKEWLKRQIIESINYAYAEGIDKPEITGWTWPLVNLAAPRKS